MSNLQQYTDITSYQTIPVIDSDFETFDFLNDLESNLRDPHTGNFYHDSMFVNA